MQAIQTIHRCDSVESLMEIVNVAAQRLGEIAEERRRDNDRLEEQKYLMAGVFAQEEVKLNVGGTLFTTSRTVLTREKGTFFAAMFSGRWEVKMGENGAVFIDRSPAHFGVILDHLRGRAVNLRGLSNGQFQALKAEVDYYQIASLAKLLGERQSDRSMILQDFATLNEGRVTNNQPHSITLISEFPFTAERTEFTVLVEGVGRVLLGVGYNDWESNAHWVLRTDTGDTCCRSGGLDSYYGGPLPTESEVKVILEDDAVSFVVNGLHCGSAFSGMRPTAPLHFIVRLIGPGTSVVF